jgi:hypothetical protein
MDKGFSVCGHKTIMDGEIAGGQGQKSAYDGRNGWITLA